MADKAPIQMTRTELLAYIQDVLYPEIDQLRSELEWSKVASERIWIPSLDVPIRTIEPDETIDVVCLSRTGMEGDNERTV